MGSFVPWGSLSLALFLFLSMLHISSGCSVDERAALLEIQSSLMRARSLRARSLDSWGKNGDDCCTWVRVECDNSTQRVSHLDLRYVYARTDVDDHWYLNSTLFSVFHELQYLDISDNSPFALSLEGLAGLSKLRYLDLSYNDILLGGVFPAKFIGKLVSLEVLALNYNNMSSGLTDAAIENLRNLRQLNMSGNRFKGGLPASLFTLPRLKFLDLYNNNFDGHIPISSSSGPISLEVLNLGYNNLSGTLPATAFENIRSLKLGGNQFSGSLPASLFALTHLKFLDLSHNNFHGYFPINLASEPLSLEVLHLEGNKLSEVRQNEEAFEVLKNLRELYLASNQFSGNIPTFLFSLPHIEQLDLSGNSFRGEIPINPSLNLPLSLKILVLSENNLSGRFSLLLLGNLTKLEEIHLSGNANLVVDVNFPGWTPSFQLKVLLLSGCDLDRSIIAEPHFLRTQRQLAVLDLSNNSLSGGMPNWLFTKESTLQVLNLENNSLTGQLDPIGYTQPFLYSINIHMNQVEGQLPANIGSLFPGLGILNISSNNIMGHIPQSLCEMVYIESLDMSNNKLSGEVPACMFTNYQGLSQLKVSNNKLSGLIFGGVNNLSNIDELYLDGNKFEGTIPHGLSGVLKVMDLHDNKLSGKLDNSLWNLSSLVVINLAGNLITGKIHPQICDLKGIRFLDLSSNNLTGSVPNCIFTELNFLNLSGNSLSGDISFPYFNTSSLIALDIRHNQFTGNLSWVHYLENIRLLSLGGNKFDGQITQEVCKLLYLRIIDLSHNKLSGSLPACIGDISFRGGTDDQIFESAYGFLYNGSSYDLRGFTFATKGNLYTYSRNFFVSMSGIDLSANMLGGEIPWELGNLSHIKSLNLSYNFFVGPIPATIGGMQEIESLDLSHNELSGPIPSQLTQLSSLGVFSVAYNNLSGCIPNSGHLASFGMDSFLSNDNLHKITQGNMCGLGRDPVAGEDVGQMPIDPVLYAITTAAFVLAFWATIGFSFFNRYGRSVILKL